MAQTHSQPNHIADRPIAIESDGETQIIRLPADVQFDSKTIYLSRDDRTGDVILTQHPPRPARTWDELFAILDELGPMPDDFMANRPMNGPIDPHGVFDDELP